MNKDKKVVIKIINTLPKQKSFFYIPWNKEIKYSWLLNQVKHIDSNYFKITFDSKKISDITIRVIDNKNQNKLLWVEDENNYRLENWTINIDQLNEYFEEIETTSTNPKDFFVVYIYKAFLMWKINNNDLETSKKFSVKYMLTNIFRDANKNIGCIFDFSENKKKIWTIMDRPIICYDCRKKIQTNLIATATFFKDIENELDLNINPNLSLYKKMEKIQKKYWILIAILIFVVLPILLGIFTSWIWEVFKY